MRAVVHRDSRCHADSNCRNFASTPGIFHPHPRSAYDALTCNTEVVADFNESGFDLAHETN